MSKHPGIPLYKRHYATTKKAMYHSPPGVGHISFRNVGKETLWLSWDDKHYFEIASGTSFEEDAEVRFFYIKTMNSWTAVEVNVIPYT